MGADGAPRVEVEGIVSAVRERGIDVIVVGDEPRVRAELERIGASGEKIPIRHAPEVITMDDAPSMAVKQKKKSSMRMCFDLCKSGEADAVVSAGNSGAMMACGLFVLGRLPGVERPAIVTTFPTKAGECALLDMGANVDPKPTVLAQFARARLGLRAAAARQDAAQGRACSRTARRSTRARRSRARPTSCWRARRAARPRSSTSATSRGATSSAAKSTWWSPTASPATWC